MRCQQLLCVAGGIDFPASAHPPGCLGLSVNCTIVPPGSSLQDRSTDLSSDFLYSFSSVIGVQPVVIKFRT